VKRAGIIYHHRLDAAKALAGELEGVIGAANAEVWSCPSSEEDRARTLVPGTELILSIGGDGTILRAARVVVPWPVPILGINLGKLGFMTELSAAEARQKLPGLLAGEGWIEERAMLQVELFPITEAGAEGLPRTFHGLNDMVVGRGAVARVIYVEAIIDDERLTTYKSDGVIVATATGSTGYSLAIGGPILYPQSEDILLRPISPHLSLAHALVLPPTAVVELRVSTDHQAMLSVDGQIDLALHSGDRLQVRRSPHQARFLRTQPPASFYRMLTQRVATKQF
jgi:NAD+ kinase